MSRRVIRHDDIYEVVVGWDRPLRTFFAQVYDVQAFKRALAEDPDADEVLIVWRGVTPDEITEVSTVELIIEPYATMNQSQKRALLLDRGGAG